MGRDVPELPREARAERFAPEHAGDVALQGLLVRLVRREPARALLGLARRLERIGGEARGELADAGVDSLTLRFLLTSPEPLRSQFHRPFPLLAAPRQMLMQSPGRFAQVPSCPQTLGPTGMP